jgi:16S rRNA processing protein RimM
MPSPQRRADATPAPASERPPAPQDEPDDGYVAVGRVLAPFGIKGELKVQPLTDNAERFLPGSRLHAGRKPVIVAHTREARGFFYVTFEGHPDRTSVEHFRNVLLQVPEGDLPLLPEGAYYRFQVIGLTVVDRAGVTIGTLEGIIDTGANDVYRVRTPEGGELLLPALVDVVLDVDLEAGRMTVDPPDWR